MATIQKKYNKRVHLTMWAKPAWFGMKKDHVCGTTINDATALKTNQPHKVTCLVCLGLIVKAPNTLKRDITIFRALYMGYTLNRIGNMFGVTAPMVRTWIQQRVYILASVDHAVYTLFLKGKKPVTWGNRKPTYKQWYDLIQVGDIKKNKEVLKPLFDQLEKDVFSGGRKLT